MAYFTNDLPGSFFCCIYGLNLAEQAGPSPKLAEMYASTMIVAAAIPPLALGRVALEPGAGGGRSDGDIHHPGLSRRARGHVTSAASGNGTKPAIR